MKNLYRAFLLTMLFSLLFQARAYAAVTFDKSNVSKGLLSIKYDGSLANGVKVVVDKGSDRYIYTLRNNSVNTVPLQMGAGGYTVSVMENIGGNKYKPLSSETVTVGSVDESAMYSASVMVVDYNASTQAVPYYKTLAGEQTGRDMAEAVYGEIVANYSYDFDKAKSVANDYTPVIDATFNAKKGICYDYAALFAGALRSQGTPAKLVMGYAPDISQYHAWNEVFVDGKWVVVDTTYDAQAAKADMQTTFAKDGSKYKIVKIY